MGLTKDYLRFEHGGSCGCVASTNGELVAINASTVAVASNEYLNFYNMRTNEKINEIIGSKKAVTCVKSYPGKSLLAIGYFDGSVRLYDQSNPGSENEPLVFTGHKKAVNCIAFSNDGLMFASGGKDGGIVLWDILAEKGLFRLFGHKDTVTQLQFVRDDRFLISSSKDSLVKFWSIESQTCFYTLFDHRSELYSMCLLRDETILVTASSELELMVFELTWKSGETIDPEPSEQPDAKKRLESGQQDAPELQNMANRYVSSKVRGRLIRQSKGRALQLVVSPDERIFVCLGADKLADVYRVFTEEESSKRLVKKLKTAKRKASDGKMAVTEEEVSKDVTIVVARIADFSTLERLKWLDFADSVSIAVDKFVYRAFALLATNTIHALDIEYSEAANSVDCNVFSTLDKLGHKDGIRALSVSSSNNLLASGGGNEVILWSTHSLRPTLKLVDEPKKEIVSLTFAPGDNYILSGGKEGELGLFEVSSAELVETRKAHTGAVWSIAVAPDKKSFATASADKTIKFWNFVAITEGTKQRLSVREARVLELPDEALGATYSPDGKFFVAALLNNTASVYFVDTLKFFISLYGHSLPVTCVDVHQDSKLCVTGSVDKSVKIWGLDFGDCHKSFHAHDDTVTAVMFSPGEETLFWSCGKDGKVKQWDAVKFQLVQTLDRHMSDVRCLAQVESGAIMFSASHDLSIRCWERTEEMLILEEEEQVQREEEYERRLADEEDVVPGEQRDAEAGVASAKTSYTIASAENIIESVDISRNERIQRADNENHQPHPLLLAYKSKSLEHFVVDVIAKCRPTELERSLLMVPLSYVHDILSALSTCARQHYKVEFATHVALYLIRVHLSHLLASVEAVPLLERMKEEIPTGIEELRNVAGVNLSALRLLAAEIEENDEVKMFAEVAAGVDAKKAKSKNKTRKAIVKTLV